MLIVLIVRVGSARGGEGTEDQTSMAPQHRYQYFPGSTRLYDKLYIFPSWAPDPYIYNESEAHRTYDDGGNVHRGWDVVLMNRSGAGYTRTYTRSFYSADERLRAYQHNHEITPTEAGIHERRGYFADYYYYDALGRRIQVRTRRNEGLCRVTGDAVSTTDCTSAAGFRVNHSMSGRPCPNRTQHQRILT